MVENILGRIPEDWRYLTLGEACKLGGGDVQTGPFGSRLHAADYVAVGVPSIMPQNIGDNRVIDTGIARITTFDAERLQRYLVRIGDIVYSRRGDVERRALIREREDGWLCGTGCLRVRLGHGVTDPAYAAFYLGHPAVREWIVRHAHGATMPNLNTAILGACPFVLPPIKEQQAVAAILGALDDKIELNRRMNETLEAMMRAIFKDWFVDFGPTRAKMENLAPYLAPEIWAWFPDRLGNEGKPESWVDTPLSELCKLGRGASPRPINDYMNGEVPWIKIADATAANGPFIFQTTEKVKTQGAEKSVAVGPGDLILSNSATCGVPMFVELHGCIHDGWLYFRDLQKITKTYLFHVLVELGEHLVQIADGSVQKNLNTNLVGRQKIMVPPMLIMDAFEAQARVTFAKMRENGLESRTLSATRDLLLSKLISGEIRMHDAEKELERIA